MKNNKQSIDGFTPRKRSVSTSKNSDKSTGFISERRKIAEARAKKTSRGSHKNESVEKALQNLYIDIDNSSEPQNTPENNQKLERKLHRLNQKRSSKGRKKLSLIQFKRRRIIHRIFLLIIILAISFLGYHGYKAMNNLSRIFDGNVFDIIKKDKLKADNKGRTNILVFGTSPKGWDGEYLADSIMVVSVNQDTKKAYTISLPRDLWVKHNCPNWLGTTSGKLNESYGCGKLGQGRGKSDEEAEKLGQKELASTVSKVTGLDMHYTVHGNWKVLIDSINAIGGVDIKVEVYDGSPEMYDVATKVRYKNGQVAHMNGDQALAFSRARGSHGGYGLSGGNFDRERNQQKIIKATVDKINSSGKYNPASLVGILQALGDNVQTTISASEIQTFADLATSFKADNITSLPLLDPTNGINLMTTGNISGASAVIPTAGTYDYSDIHQYINEKTADRDKQQNKENARIVILNGTSINGLAGRQKTKLDEEDYNVVGVDSAPRQNYTKTKVYYKNESFPNTIKRLGDKFNTLAEKLPDDLAKFASGADIVIVLGKE